jgi:hypothetical protein
MASSTKEASILSQLCTGFFEQVGLNFTLKLEHINNTIGERYLPMSIKLRELEYFDKETFPSYQIDPPPST